MIEAFDHLLGQTRPAFTQQRTFERARFLALSALVGLGRRTISGLLCASGQQFADWSAAYRLFEFVHRSEPAPRPTDAGLPLALGDRIEFQG